MIPSLIKPPSCWGVNLFCRNNMKSYDCCCVFDFLRFLYTLSKVHEIFEETAGIVFCS